MLTDQRSISKRKIIAEDTHKPPMFQSYTKVILSYLKLSYREPIYS